MDEDDYGNEGLKGLGRIYINIVDIIERYLFLSGSMLIGGPIYEIWILRIVRWVRGHCPPDTGLEIQTRAVWGRARYFSVTEAPHNTVFYKWMGKKHFRFFQTADTGERTPNSSVKGSSVNLLTTTLGPPPWSRDRPEWSNCPGSSQKTDLDA